MPTMTELLHKVGNRLSNGTGCYVSSMDLNKAYWSLKVDEKDQHKLAFSYDNKHWKAKRMLYGLATAPSAWSRVVSKIFNHSDILVYLDDLLIISADFESHINAIRFVLEQCIKYGLTLSAKKVNLCSNHLVFLGHHIDKHGIKPTQKHEHGLTDYFNLKHDINENVSMV